MEQTGRSSPQRSLHGGQYILFDLIAVVVFVAIGRDVHGHADDLAGLIKTSWPFAAGVVVGWLGTRQWQNPLTRTAILVWLATVAVGMVLRVITGQGIAVPFVFVSLGFFALTELGWRIIARVGLSWRDRAPR
ncbi:DUF3054 domain-containing protein [Ferrimicrobium sp.]|uniref:DUF3054 domain-containing protein n=1 Tax=Ferrimicrobium sp. TaxID=2926050 RepID=UPI002628B246|nr:DUF3054 domain-containing protein [Ferrimicrobium sp.]